MNPSNTSSFILAEDDENLGLLLKEYLIAKGFETDLYSDGEAAYKGFTKNHPYNLCILDIMMPKKDGISLAKDIRLNLNIFAANPVGCFD